jgi:hypothetical protein
MSRGVVMCHRSDLQDGVTVVLEDANKWTAAKNSALTIVKHNEGWKFLCRFHQELSNREREVLHTTTCE